MGGNAVALAVRDLREQLIALAADLFETAPSDIEIVDGSVSVAGSPQRRLTLATLAALAVGSSSATSATPATPSNARASPPARSPRIARHCALSASNSQKPGNCRSAAANHSAASR